VGARGAVAVVNAGAGLHGCRQLATGFPVRQAEDKRGEARPDAPGWQRFQCLAALAGGEAQSSQGAAHHHHHHQLHIPSGFLRKSNSLPRCRQRHHQAIANDRDLWEPGPVVAASQAYEGQQLGTAAVPATQPHNLDHCQEGIKEHMSKEGQA